MFVIFTYIHWNIDSAASGKFPASRFDGTAFDAASEAFRVDRAGALLGGHLVLLFIKGDWAEFQVTLGPPTFSSL